MLFDGGYRPTLLDELAALSRVTKATELDYEGCDVTLELIEVLVGTPFGDRITSLYDFDETRLLPDAVLAGVELFVPRLAREHLAS